MCASIARDQRRKEGCVSGGFICTSPPASLLFSRTDRHSLRIEIDTMDRRFPFRKEELRMYLYI